MTATAIALAWVGRYPRVVAPINRALTAAIAHLIPGKRPEPPGTLGQHHHRACASTDVASGATDTATFCPRQKKAAQEKERNTMILTHIGYGLSGLLGLGIIFIGTRFLLAPKAAAADFGISIGQSGDPYLSVKGVRDIASGLVALILLATGVPHVLGGFMLAASIIPIGDAIIVLRRKGSKATAYGVHAATAAVMLLTAALLFIPPA